MLYVCRIIFCKPVRSIVSVIKKVAVLVTVIRMTSHRELEEETLVLYLLHHYSISHEGRMNVSRCLFSPWLKFNSWLWRTILRDVSLGDDTLPTSSPQQHYTAHGHRGGRPESNHGQTMAEKALPR